MYKIKQNPKAEIKVIFVDSYKRLMNILNEIDNLAHLKLIVYFDAFSQDEKRRLQVFNSKISILSYAELIVSL